MGKVIELGRTAPVKSPVAFEVMGVEVADLSPTNASAFEEAHSSVVTCYADNDGEPKGEEIAKLVFHGVVLDAWEASVIANAVQEAFDEISKERETE